MKHGNKVHIPKKEVVNPIFHQKNEHKTVTWASRIIHHVATTTQYWNPIVIEASKNTSQILQLSHFPNRCLAEHFFFSQRLRKSDSCHYLLREMTHQSSRFSSFIIVHACSSHISFHQALFVSDKAFFYFIYFFLCSHLCLYHNFYLSLLRMAL